ncbi:hypothetical protein MTER_39110 [Mycolicibacter terrae]|uniref:Mce/MlaD domain-containing protein n=1 Tax=Mycolicibacter terrae TaxID=1788 RepID=A0AAD1I2Y2_9MYCO|nr:hypothetical protein MTER_39110 [Mycolicibacter terrae]SNV53351.1 Mce family protein Mce5C [Mycolicibacter terrae]
MGNAMTSRPGTFFRQRRARPLESYNTTWLGFGALAVVAVVVAAALFVKVLGVGYTRYTAEFAQAAALAPGNPIVVAGIEVGRVASMRLAGDHVEAGLTVRNDIGLGKDTRAKIQVMTILGSRYLKLEPAGSGALPGKRINLAHTEVPYSLESLLEDATTTFDQVDSDQFGQSLAVLGQQLSGLPPGDSASDGQSALAGQAHRRSARSARHPARQHPAGGQHAAQPADAPGKPG